MAVLITHRAMPSPADPGSRRVVLYSCTALFVGGSMQRSLLLDWDLMPNADDAFKRIRRAATGVTQVLDERTNENLRLWLRDREALAILVASLEADRTYELELCSTAVTMVLGARWVMALPLADRPRSRCPAAMLRGRRLWAEQRENGTGLPAGADVNLAERRIEQVFFAQNNGH